MTPNDPRNGLSLTAEENWSKHSFSFSKFIIFVDFKPKNEFHGNIASYSTEPGFEDPISPRNPLHDSHLSTFVVWTVQFNPHWQFILIYPKHALGSPGWASPGGTNYMRYNCFEYIVIYTLGITSVELEVQLIKTIFESLFIWIICDLWTNSVFFSFMRNIIFDRFEGVWTCVWTCREFLICTKVAPMLQL